MHVHVLCRRMDRTTTTWSAATWGLLIAVCGALFLDGLDVSMVGVALPSIRDDLGISTSQLQWIVSGYVLGYGGVLLPRGRAGGLLGPRRGVLGAGRGFPPAAPAPAPDGAGDPPAAARLTCWAAGGSSSSRSASSPWPRRSAR